ncbi:MAG: TonB-dependent receptor, partial [Marinobacter sp.]|uniref:TonB-dependent receptor n=1 Tax=Marinobacter sp. TaxID=50741 RepID=UPI00299EF451
MTTLAKAKLHSALLVALGCASTAMAQENADNGSVTTLDALEVVATRGLDSLNVNPGSVTVVDRETIEKQSALGGNLSDVLAQTVPGLAPSTHGQTTVAQTLRGRNLFVLIDGIPQTISLRDGLHSLNSIDPNSIERIEVIRGSTGVYGFGGTGGIINIITRKTEKGAPQFRTEVHGGFSTEHFEDSGRYGVAQSVTGGAGAFDYQLRGSVEERNSFFDADGDRIPPNPNQQGGIADTLEYDVLAKLGYDMDSQRRVEFTSSYYEIKQDSNYVLEDGIHGVRKTRAVRGESLGEDEGTENLNLNLTYDDARLFGDTSFGAQLYYRDYMTRFDYFENFYQGGGQSKIESERLGSRLDFKTPFNLLNGAKLLWGLDTLDETSAQPLEDGRTFVPEMDQTSVAGFLQGEVRLDPKWTLSAGMRYEKFWFEVDDYTSLFGADVEGGELDYSETVFNAGARYQVNDVWATTATFSQGFTVPEIGRVLRQPANNTSLDQIRPEPQVVDNYEIGAEALWNQADLALTLFYSESELGTQLGSAQ